MRHRVHRKRVIVRDEDVPAGVDWGEVMRAVGGRHFPDLKKFGAAWTFPSHQLDAFHKLVAPSETNNDTDKSSVDADMQTDSDNANTDTDTDQAIMDAEMPTDSDDTDKSSVDAVTQTDSDNANTDTDTDTDKSSVDAGTQTDAEEPIVSGRYKHDIDDDVRRFVSDWVRQAGLEHLFPVF